MAERENLLQQSLNFYQSQVYSLNHLYNMHYSVMQNLNTNVTRIIMSQNDILLNQSTMHNPLAPPIPIFPGANYFNSQPPLRPPPPPPPPRRRNSQWFPTHPDQSIRRNSFTSNIQRNRPNNNLGAIGSNRFWNAPPSFRQRNRQRRNTMSNRNSSPIFRWRTLTDDLERTLHNSVYDRNSRVPLPREIFNNTTTTDTWQNMSILHDLSNNSRCPITQEVFNPVNNVSRINHCGHIFNTSSIIEWFRYDTRCPVCRYNLRTASLNSDISRNNSTYDDLSRNNILREFSTLFDTSNNTFDLSENIYNLSNEIATNIVSAFNSLGQNIQDLSNNFIAAEMTFNFPQNGADINNFGNLFNPFANNTNTLDNTNTFNNTNMFHNNDDIYDNNTTEQTIIQPSGLESNLLESDRLENIVENILNSTVFSEPSINNEESKTEEELQEEKMEDA